MFTEWINEKCEKATERVQSILGSRDHWFDFNRRLHRFEFRERRVNGVQTIFPLTVGNEPLHDITDWEIAHAVKFIRKNRYEEAQKRFEYEQRNKKYKG